MGGKGEGNGRKWRGKEGGETNGELHVGFNFENVAADACVCYFRRVVFVTRRVAIADGGKSLGEWVECLASESATWVSRLCRETARRFTFLSWHPRCQQPCIQARMFYVVIMVGVRGRHFELHWSPCIVASACDFEMKRRLLLHFVSPSWIWYNDNAK